MPITTNTISGYITTDNTSLNQTYESTVFNFSSSIPTTKIKSSVTYDDILNIFVGKNFSDILNDVTKLHNKKIHQEDLKRQAYNDKFRKLIKGVDFNKEKNTTTVHWSDGTHTYVTCQEGDTFDPYMGVILCAAKKFFGNGNVFNEVGMYWADQFNKPVDK